MPTLSIWDAGRPDSGPPFENMAEGRKTHVVPAVPEPTAPSFAVAPLVTLSAATRHLSETHIVQRPNRDVLPDLDHGNTISDFEQQGRQPVFPADVEGEDRDWDRWDCHGGYLGMASTPTATRRLVKTNRPSCSSLRDRGHKRARTLQAFRSGEGPNNLCMARREKVEQELCGRCILVTSCILASSCPISCLAGRFRHAPDHSRHGSTP